MELAGYLSVIRRWWLTLVVATGVSALSGYVVANQLPPRYEAEARLLVGPISSDVNTLRAAGQLAETYSEVVTTNPVLEGVIRDLGITLDVGELRTNVRATASDVTRVLTLRVELHDPELASRAANALATELIRFTEMATRRPEGEIRVIERARAPTSPVSPQVPLIVGLAAFAGLLGAIVLIMLAEYLDDTVRDEGAVITLTGVPILGSVFLQRVGWRKRRDPGPALGAVVDASTATGYGVIAEKLSSAPPERASPRFLVVGVQGQAEADQVAAGLASVLAVGGKSVLFVRTRDDSPPATVLVRPLAVAEASGGAPGSEISGRPSRALDVQRYRPEARYWNRPKELLDRAEEHADVIVVTTAPTGSSAGTLTWARSCDATVLVVHLGQAKREGVESVLENLRLATADVLGIVLVKAPSLTMTIGRLLQRAPATRAEPVGTGSQEEPLPTFPDLGSPMLRPRGPGQIGGGGWSQGEPPAERRSQ